MTKHEIHEKLSQAVKAMTGHDEHAYLILGPPNREKGLILLGQLMGMLAADIEQETPGQPTSAAPRREIPEYAEPYKPML